MCVVDASLFAPFSNKNIARTKGQFRHVSPCAIWT